MYYPDRDDFYETENEVCSNFDGAINNIVVDELIKNNCKSSYSAWDWHGYVWHNDGKFHIRVRRYGSVVGEYECDTMEEIRAEACENHGWE